MRQARPDIAWIFFSLYVAIGYLVVLNMFVGIITKFFDVVRAARAWVRGVVRTGRPPQVHNELETVDLWQRTTVPWTMYARLRCAD